MLPPSQSILNATAIGHLVLAFVCFVLLLLPAPPILNAHPALKPMKFGISIFLFLGTLGILLPYLNVSESIKSALALTLAATMLLEIFPIALQPLRGTTSHFNIVGRFNASLWMLMMVAIVIMTLAMTVFAILATFRPLLSVEGKALSPLLTFAWRAGLWVFLLSAVSGFAMGGRLSHSVLGTDGGPGLPIFNWSTRHGDMRVSHFFAMHALQVFPLTAWLLQRSSLTSTQSFVLLGVGVVFYTLWVVFTFFQALAGRPLLPA